jgi:hypothetical protein
MFRAGGSLVNGGDPVAFWTAYRAQNGPVHVQHAGATPALLGHPAARAVSHAALRFWICSGDRVLPVAHQLAHDASASPCAKCSG